MNRLLNCNILLYVLVQGKLNIYINFFSIQKYRQTGAENLIEAGFNVGYFFLNKYANLGIFSELSKINIFYLCIYLLSKLK